MHRSAVQHGNVSHTRPPYLPTYLPACLPTYLYVGRYLPMNRQPSPSTVTIAPPRTIHTTIDKHPGSRLHAFCCCSLQAPSSVST
ncbi:hypothetical protein LX32DRAFT_120790 [Colletotrichum zoysiae]|uniref:Uncharacterized protein n=1 Tax=Colletotrichum zoysiae TaxID=1216348 RepID=A0AAD9LVR6_9PEZI|nr:hypothetical protein LX32DRAFT_120790 [Colletotrichum zoysiae]